MLIKKTPLQKAIKNGQIEEIRLLINKGEDIKKIAYLALATETDNDEIFDILLEAGADVNDKLPLAKAIKKNRLDWVKKLLDNGANQNQEAYMNIAISDNNIELCKLLTDAGADIDDSKYLLSAVKSESIEITKILIEAGANVNSITKKGDSPLYIALGGDKHYKPNNEIITLLLENGAKSILTGKKDELALMKNFQLTSVEKFKSPLFKVFGEGSDELIKQFLKTINSQEKTIKGLSVLHIACRSAKSWVVKELILEGADINSEEESGVKPFFFIGGQEVEEKIDLFKTLGFDINAHTKEGYNILHISALDDNAEAVEACVKSGIDIESLVKVASSTQRINALHLACMNGNTKAVEKLIELGADVNSVYKDENGQEFSPQRIAKPELRWTLQKAGGKIHT